jgi:hypothetical protein
MISATSSQYQTQPRKFQVLVLGVAIFAAAFALLQ